MKKYLSILVFLLLFFIFGCTTTTIEISFETNGGDAIETLKPKSMDDLVLPEPTKEGYSFLGWYEDSDFKTPFDPTRVRDNYVITLYALWIDELGIPIVVSHYLEGVDGTYALDETITDYIDPLSSTMTFEPFIRTYEGYGLNEDLVTFEQNPSTLEMHLNLYYERNSYTITFVSDVGEPIETLSIKHGHAVTAPSTPTVKGFDFSQFSPALPETMPMENLTVNIVWIEKDKATVTFETNGGSTIDPITDYVTYPIDQPTDPYKQGYAFTGWYTDTALTTEYDFDSVLSTDITLYASYEPIAVSYHVEHYTETLSGDYELETTTIGSALSDSTVVVSPRDMTGFEYNPDYTLDESTITVNPDESSVAKLYYHRLSYTIEFESNASFSIESMTVKYDDTINEPSDPIREYYTFSGWYTDSTFLAPFNFDDPMPGYSFILYAKWVGQSMTLTFSSMGGTAVSPLTAPLGSPISQPIPPTRDGYLFDGWYLDSLYNEAFTDWVMPLGNITIYAKWVPAQYTLSFETNGGTLIDSQSVAYLSTIAISGTPVKADYLFGGWYLDAALTQSFNLTIMPNHDVTLYAKWISMADSSKLYFIVQEDPGTFVNIEGVVYAKASNGFNAVFIADETGFIQVYLDPSLVAIGDRISVDGILEPWNEAPIIMNPSNLAIISSSQTLPLSLDSSIEAVHSFDDSLEYYYQPYQLEGLVVVTETGYGLLDVEHQLLLPLSSRFIDESTQNALVNHWVHVTGFGYTYHDGWVFAIMSQTDVPMSDSTKASLVYYDLINQLKDRFYYPMDRLMIDELDSFGFGSQELIIEGSNATYFESDLSTIALLYEPITLTIPVVITVNATDFNFELPVQLLPYEITPISDFLLAQEGTHHFLQGTIVAAANGQDFILKDDTASVCISAELGFVEGDFVELMVVRNNDVSFVVIEDDDLLDYWTISEENDLENPAYFLSGEEFAALDPTDPLIYGRYIELRGFLTMQEWEFHAGFVLSDDINFTVEINPITYTGFETLFQYTNLEVYLRGFVTQNEDGEVFISYIGIRNDVYLPEYTDQERVDMIVTLFSKEYGEKTFTVDEPFILMPHHPILGGDIVWELLDSTPLYYDTLTHAFSFTDVMQTIKFRMTISVGSVSETYLFTTYLNPPTYTPASEIKDRYSYEEIYLKGTVIYREPYFIYVQDASGIFKVEYDNMDCYVGDVVVIKGFPYANDSWDDIDGYYIGVDWDNRENPLRAIIKRHQTATIELTPMTIDAINRHDPSDANFYHSYVEVSGYLDGNLYQYDDFTLSLGGTYVTIVPANEYIYYQLLSELIDQPGPVPITLQAYVFEYDLDTDTYRLYYTGIDSITGTPTYTLTEKLDLIQNYIVNTYSQDYPSGYTAFSLPSTDTDFGSAITYSLGVGDDIYVYLNNDTLATVLSPVSILIYVSVILESTERQFTFPITILPVETSEEPITIAEALVVEDGVSVTLMGRILSFTNHESGYLALLQDETGLITVTLPYGKSYYDYSMIGRNLIVEGTKSTESGRVMVNATNYTLTDTPIVMSAVFTPMTVSDIYGLNLYDLETYGKPISLTGRLIQMDYTGIYALDLGDDLVVIQAIYTFDNYLANYVGYEVTINGFFLGKQTLSSSLVDYYALAYTSYDYGDNINIQLLETDEAVIAQMVADQLTYSMYMKDFYEPYEIVYLPSYSSLVPSAAIGFTLYSSAPVAMVSGNVLSFAISEIDTVVDVEMTVTVGSSTATKILSFVLIGTPLNNLEDLFLVCPGTLTLNFEGTVLMSKWGYSYFLIDGQVYYYEGFIDDYFEPNMHVFITGRKTMVDSIPDFTFGVSVNQSWDEDPILIPEIITIAELYENDYALYPIHRNQIKVTGKLYYDDFLDKFYLEDNGDILYIREDLTYYEGGSEYFSYHPEIERNVLFDAIASPITLTLFLPNRLIMNEYLLADFRGYEFDYELPILTPEERLNIAIERFFLLNEIPHFNAGDDVNEFLPYADEPFMVSYDYSLVNEVDSSIIDMENYGRVLAVSTQTLVPLILTATYYDSDLDTYYTDTAEFTVTVDAIESLNLYDFLYAPLYTYYQVEGTIQAMDTESHGWILIKDSFGRLLVKMTSLPSAVYAVGDYVRLSGMKTYNFWQDYVPFMEYVMDIEVISSGSVETTFPVMTISDILALNYLDVESFCLPITFTGTVIFSGNVSYPSFDLREDGYLTNDYDLALYGTTYNDFNDYMGTLVGSQVVVTGYLVGFEYIYQAFDWKLYVTSVDVIEP